jgi:hypothetical protein
MSTISVWIKDLGCAVTPVTPGRDGFRNSLGQASKGSEVLCHTVVVKLGGVVERNSAIEVELAGADEFLISRLGSRASFGAIAKRLS